MDTHFEPQAPSLETILSAAIKRLPLAWSVVSYRLLLELAPDLQIFLLRSLPTAPEYAVRISEAHRMARRQLRRWGYAENLGLVEHYTGVKTDAAVQIIASDMRSALEILRCKSAYRAGSSRTFTQTFAEFSEFVQRYPL